MRELANSSELLRLTQKQLSVRRNATSLLASPSLDELREFFREKRASREDLGFFLISPDYISIASMRDVNVGTINLIAQQRGDLLDRGFAGRIELIPPVISDVPLADQSGGLAASEPTMFVAAPIRDQHGVVLAVLTLRLDPRMEFTQIAQLGRFGNTGETYAIDNQARLLTESRFQEHLEASGLTAPGQSGILSVRITDPGGNLVEGFQPTAHRGGCQSNNRGTWVYRYSVLGCGTRRYTLAW